MPEGAEPTFQEAVSARTPGPQQAPPWAPDYDPVIQTLTFLTVLGGLPIWLKWRQRTSPLREEVQSRVLRDQPALREGTSVQDAAGDSLEAWERGLRILNLALLGCLALCLVALSLIPRPRDVGVEALLACTIGGVFTLLVFQTGPEWALGNCYCIAGAFLGVRRAPLPVGKGYWIPHQQPPPQPPEGPARPVWNGCSVIMDLRRDLPAGLAVFLVSVPLCLGIAQASGAPPEAGLLSGVVGGVLVGALGGSPLLVAGPAAGLATLVFYGSQRVGGFSALLTATVLAGLIQILFGLFHGGLLARLLPTAVIRGMMSGIGLIMIYQQIPHLLGHDAQVFGAESIQRGLVSAALSSVTWPPLVVGLSCLAVLVVWERWLHRRYPAVPGAVLAVGLGLTLQQALRLGPEHVVPLPPHWMEIISRPDWSALTHPQTWVLAFTLALVASVEALITAEAIDRLDPEHRVTSADRELVAQGLGNVACGLLGALPLTGVIMRSSVNVAAGGHTRAAAVVSGLVLLLAALLAQPLLASIPLASLAAVLLVVAFSLLRPQQIREIFRQGPSQAVPFSLTAAGILLANLHTGILLGLAASALYILRDQYRSHGFHAERQGRILEVKLGPEVGFFHKAALVRTLESAQEGDLVVIDGTDSRSIHFDVIEAINEFRQRAPFRRIHVGVGGIPGIPTHSEEHMQQIEDQYRRLIENNREWVAERLQEDPHYFEHSSQGQTPTFLFIGCSDSRVPAETITKTDPGMLFVHRNIANVVSLQDVNLMSVVQYSVEHLKVPHIIVCGHYGCGGVRAALSNSSLGLIDNWITPIKMTCKLHHEELNQILDPKQRERRIIELHVIQQVRNLLKTSIVQNTQRHFGRPQVHGWVYDLETGLINDLQIELNVKDHLHPVFHYHE